MKMITRRIVTSVRGLFDQATREREAEITRLDEALARNLLERNALRKALADHKNALARFNGELSRLRAEAQHEQRASSSATAALRHELDKVRRELEVAQAENRRLWEVYERDHARVLKERAFFDRQRADAETAAVLSRQEE